MTEKQVQESILNMCDNIYQDAKWLTSGNVSHLKPCLLHDIAALKTNIFILIRDNTKLSEKLWKLKDK